MTNETENPGKREKNERKNWFHSLSRRRKSSTSTNSASQKQPSNNSSTSTGVTPTTSTLTSSQESSPGEASNNLIVGKDRKRKDERKNFFQRLKKIELGIHFLMKQKKTNSTESMSSNSNDQSAEGIVCYPNDLFPMPLSYLDPPEMIPFSHSYSKLITKKWLEDGLQSDRGSRVMYKACSEMLSQVWYWGEISRREAQRQLKDKPNGSFLVRDSETKGSFTSWYTLSFRIENCTLHYRLEYRSNYWQFEHFKYESIVEMIEDILHRCTKDNVISYVRAPNELQPPRAVVLKYPVSRYNNMMKLQDLCRRVIQQHVSVEKMQELQIPVKLQEYLAETPGLVFQSS